MTKKEFCDRVGINCSDACYEKYNTRYMESDLDKDAFCATISVLDIVNDMQSEISKLQEQLITMKEQRDECYRKCRVLLDEKVTLSRETNKTRV